LFTSLCTFSISSRQFSGGIRAFTALLIDHVVACHWSPMSNLDA
jgi:hypothetical protein